MRELWAFASSEAGMQPLSEAPEGRFEPLETALADRLLQPFGRAALLSDLARRPQDLPTVVWALRAGPSAALDERSRHFFAVLDHPALNGPDDTAFAAAACAT